MSMSEREGRMEREWAQISEEEQAKVERLILKGRDLDANILAALSRPAQRFLNIYWGRA